MAESAREDLTKKEKERLSKKQESGETHVSELDAKKNALEKEIEEIRQKIKLEDINSAQSRKTLRRQRCRH